MMKNLKKVLALVLVFAMSLSVVAFAGTVYPDVEDTATYAEAVNILKSLSIMQGDEQGNFNPDKTVTRGEMATILCNLAGVGEQAPVDTGFADTTKEHWASGYVAYAKNAGWINGYSADAFGPDDVVKYEQAIKLVMAVANWGIYAEENGGYPTGWLMAAAEAEVTKTGAAGSVGEDCIRSKIAMILYYALDANIMKQTAFGDKRWEIIEGETILSKNLNTYKVEGKVENTYKLTDDLDDGYVDFFITKTNDIDVTDKLGAEARTEDGEKTIGYDLYDVNAAGTNAADLLAYSSIAYIHVDDDDEASIVAIAAKGSKNKVYEITDMELVYDAAKDSAERDTRKPNFEDPDNYKFSYWNDRDEDNAISYVKVDPAVIVVLNNEIQEKGITSLGKTTAEVLKAIVPANGTIKMVDTDNDGYIDLYEAKDYVVAVVESVNAARQRIIFKAKTAGIKGGYITFDDEINVNLKEVSMTLDGKEIAIEDLAEYDVLTISTNDSEDPRYYDIVVTRNVVEGKINSMNDSKSVVFINSEEYEFVGNGLVEYRDVEMNDEGKFYLAANGEIAYFEDETVASTNYGVVDKFVADSMGTVSMKLLTLDGTKLTANVADKVKLNGVKVNLEDAVDTADEKGAFDKDEKEVGNGNADIFDDMGLVIGMDLTYTVKVDGKDVEKTHTYFDVIKAIVDGKEDIIGATGEQVEKLNKLITYDVANDEIDEIAFPIQSTDAKKFGYVGTTKGEGEVEWQANNYRFQGSKTLSDKTVVFNLDGNIDDWKVAKAENLVDENLYTPYYFANQDDGTAGVVVIFSSASTVNQDASLAFFVDYRTGVYEVNGDEEDVVYVNYYVDGALATEALPVYDDEYVTMKAGDAFLYAADDKGIVDTIVPVYRIADNKFGNLGKGDLDDFMMYEEGNLDNEVYYGLLVKAASGKIQVAPAPKAGDAFVSADAFNNIAVPDTAKVLQFNAYASTDAKKFVACESIVDLEVSTYTKVVNSSDIDLSIDDAEKDLTYVFFRMNNGVVTEVVGIDYVK